jgi:hypothetical protein
MEAEAQGTETQEAVDEFDYEDFEVDENSEVKVEITYDTSAAPHKVGEPYLYVMYDAAKPDGGKLYFTEAEWDAFVKGVRDGEFDLDDEGNLPPVPEEQRESDDEEAEAEA